MAPSRTVFDTFDFEKRCDLEIRVRGHSGSSKLVPFDRLSGFLLASYSNFVSKCTVFETFAFEKYCDPGTPGSGLSRSLEMTPFDRRCMTSHSHYIYIVTLALVCTVENKIRFTELSEFQNECRGPTCRKLFRWGWYFFNIFFTKPKTGVLEPTVWWKPHEPFCSLVL